MSATNSTPNYGLSQFIGTDVPGWLSDYNSDNAKIDTAIYQAKAAADAAGTTAGQAANDITTINQTLTTQAAQISAAAQSASQAQTTAGQALTAAQGADAKAEQALAAVGSGSSVANLQVSTTGWALDSGSGRQKKTLTVTKVNSVNPMAAIGVSPGAVAPTDAEIAAFGVLVAIHPNDTTNTIDLYATAVPSSAFYLQIGGVTV